jgi:hypothetical protein
MDCRVKPGNDSPVLVVPLALPKQSPQPPNPRRHRLNHRLFRRLRPGLFAQPPEIGQFGVAPFALRAQNLDTGVHAFVADVDLGSGDQFFDVVLALAAERAVKRWLGLGFLQPFMTGARITDLAAENWRWIILLTILLNRCL